MKPHTDGINDWGFFLFNDKRQNHEDILHLGYTYNAKFYKQGEYIRTW